MRTIEFLVSQGANLDCTDQNGEMPAHRLLQRGDRIRQKAMKICDITMDDLLEQCLLTELHMSAASLPGASLLSVEQLERLRPDINAPDIEGMTPLHWACRRSNAVAVRLLLQSVHPYFIAPFSRLGHKLHTTRNSPPTRYAVIRYVDAQLTCRWAADGPQTLRSRIAVDGHPCITPSIRVT